MAAADTPAHPGRVNGFLTGARYLGRGISWTAAHPGQWLFGLVPAVVVLVAYAAGLIALAANAGAVAAAVTPFADHWAPAARAAVRLAAGLSIVGIAAFVAVVTFTAIVLVIGGPFYERLAVRVEDDHGGAPREPAVPILRQVRYAAADAAVLAAAAGAFAAAFFVLGFVPVVGQTVVPVLATAVSGYLLTCELTAIALQRRGLRRGQRLRLIRDNRAAALGFGVATALLFLVPLGAVLAMPGAVAGATLLAREVIAPARS